jgi:hypothetical protein
VTDCELEFWVLVGALLGAVILIQFWEPPVEFLDDSAISLSRPLLDSRTSTLARPSLHLSANPPLRRTL